MSSVSGITTNRPLEDSGKGEAKLTSPGFFLSVEDAGTKLNSISHAVVQGRSLRYIPEQVFRGVL